MARNEGRPDYILMGSVALLLIFGILVLSSVSSPLSQERFGNPFYFLKHQFFFGLLPGLILAFLAFQISLELLKKWAPFLFLINLILMLLVFLPFSQKLAGGAARWVSLGKISFQPSEFLKLTFICYLAAWLSSSKFKKFSNQTFFAFLIIIGIISLFLIFQPDISTLGVIFASAVLIYFLAGAPLWQTFLTILAGLGGLFVLIKLAPYRTARLLVFFNPEVDPMGIGYHLKQALIAIGSGGIFGKGLGLGMFRQKFWLLPQAMSDSIFAILAEEGGFIFSFILILLFLIFLWRGFKIAKLKEDKFSQLTAAGITCWICLQGFVNIGSMIGILPLTGIPLPFISYGGSALVSELVGVGILLNISKTP